ncbi:MAG: SURF1 family protein [Methylophilus sp.]|nr:SURF1 family protein [Methylophilus sp.]
MLCIVVFIKLGQWQYHKAVIRQNIENQYQASLHQGTIDLKSALEHPEVLVYQNVKVQGEYEPAYQILIDNQVESTRAGYHIVTPFKIKGTNQYVLVNRGWILGNDNHQDVPNVVTPAGEQEIQGMVWVPSNKIFSLENDAERTTHEWRAVWQNLDMKQYQKQAPISVLNIIIKLDPKQPAGGFVRNWQLPPSRIMTNLGYAYQWFGFAFAALAIYVYLSISRTKSKE